MKPSSANSRRVASRSIKSFPGRTFSHLTHGKRLGRFVRKGEHGVKVLSWVPISTKEPEIDQLTGQPSKTTRMRPVHAVVFHVSQTDAVKGGAQ